MSNGLPDPSQNPYAASAITDQDQLTAMQNSASYSGVTPATSVSQAMSQATQAPLSYQYPSYPNAAGLGSQDPTSGSSTVDATGVSSPSSMNAITVTTPDTTSRGANPWSFTGEANNREAQLKGS
jgi:hypothetical protein